MNFLAHARLSFNNEAVLVGNMVSDFVKGSKQFEFPPQIQAGIQLHRRIDTFTDEHPATIAAKQIFRREYRLYSGAFMDVVYDYFLANDAGEFSRESLSDFSRNTYRALDRYADLLPPSFQRMFYYMKQQNWLYNYREQRGLFNSFAGLVRRAKYLTDSGPAEQLFTAHMELLQEQYRLFWKELKPYAEQQFIELLKKTE
ncbi:ACP phosphodiesterase [Niabella ginsenosidivorans]|uniref:ACP phosphodiesterase n=1 Tax=Niabella ginsenosidivorans TaxID=1176587 RepID=A0A1A9IBE1_9BACT|nr:ACP phosphodiesterase [Niabella ginsenosidivorans]ANH84080.1 ACP phosphodiesterase [Niabella ginsenosidivorans]